MSFEPAGNYHQGECVVRIRDRARLEVVGPYWFGKTDEDLVVCVTSYEPLIFEAYRIREIRPLETDDVQDWLFVVSQGRTHQRKEKP